MNVPVPLEGNEFGFVHHHFHRPADFCRYRLLVVETPHVLGGYYVKNTSRTIIGRYYSRR